LEFPDEGKSQIPNNKLQIKIKYKIKKCSTAKFGIYALELFGDLGFVSWILF